MKISTIFLDMDGVIANWAKDALIVNGVDDPEEFQKNWPDGCPDIADALPDIPRERILETCDNTPDFWINLEKLPWADDLVEFCMSVAKKVFILTSPSKFWGCSSQKVAWLQKYYPELGNRRFIITKHKYLLAGKKRVLIDDNEDQTSSFEKKGGHIILFPAPWNCNKVYLDDPVSFVNEELHNMVKYER